MYTDSVNGVVGGECGGEGLNLVVGVNVVGVNRVMGCTIVLPYVTHCHHLFGSIYTKEPFTIFLAHSVYSPSMISPSFFVILAAVLRA